MIAMFVIVYLEATFQIMSMCVSDVCAHQISLA